MKYIIMLLCAVFCLTAAAPVQAASAEYRQAELDYLANLACITAYSDHIGLDARREMGKSGYRIDSVSAVVDNVNVKYQVISYSDLTAEGRIYILAVAGTEDKSDVNIDMDTKQVYFAGTSPAEFAANAEREDTSGLPTVHRGFNRYVQKAFFTPDESGESLGEYMAAKLRAEPESRLYLVGHSLGGAAAVLAAARLTDMGVSEKQLGVINFGAPEIGNQLFVDKYSSRLNVRRIAMTGDFVRHSLNTFFGGYYHVGEEVRWQRDRTARGIDHSVYVYFDRALRNYYAAQQAANIPSYINNEQMVDVYVEPLQLTLSPDLADDREYMQRSVCQALQNAWYDKCWFAGGDGDTRSAAAVGAKYILRQSADVRKVRDKRQPTYNMDMSAGLYDAASGALVGYSQVSSNTEAISPLMLIFYQTAQLDKAIKEQLTHKKDAEVNETQ